MNNCKPLEPWFTLEPSQEKMAGGTIKSKQLLQAKANKQTKGLKMDPL